MTVIGFAPRRRDAARTRSALLAAAKDLFGDRGYDGATLRDIGERAGVDPTLIARYFGSKAALFLESLQTKESPADLLDRDRLVALLDRVSRTGAGPALQAAVRPHADDDIQRASTAALHERLVAPLRDRLSAGGGDDAQLRAEVAVAAFAGIALGAKSGAFPALGAATTDEVVALTLSLLDGVRL